MNIVVISNLFDIILILGLVASTGIFVISRVSKRGGVFYFAESVSYIYATFFVCLFELMHYMLLSNYLDPILIINRCLFFSMINSVYTFVSVLTHYIKFGGSGIIFGKSNTYATQNAIIKNDLDKFKENILSKVVNVQRTVHDCVERGIGNTEQINEIRTDMEAILQRLTATLEIIEVIHRNLDARETPRKKI